MAPPVEVLTEQPSTIQTFLENMAVAVESGKDAVTYFKNETVTFTRNQWQELNEQFKEGVGLPAFLKSSKERDAILAYTSSQLSSFREQVNSFIENIPSPSAETKQALVTGGIAVGGLVGVGLLGYLAYRIVFGAKKVGKTVVEKSKSIFRNILIGGAVAIGGAAALFGLYKVSSNAHSFVDKLQAGEKAVKDTVTHVADAAVSIADASVKVADAAVSKMETTTTAIYEGLHQSEKSTTESVTPPTALETVSAKATEIAASDVAKEVVEITSAATLEYILTKVTNSTGPTVFYRMCESGWTIGTVLDVYDVEKGALKNPDDPQILALIPSTATEKQERERYLEAVSQMIGFFAKYGTQLEGRHEAARIKNSSLSAFRDIPVGTFIHEMKSSMEIFKNLSEGLQDLPSISTFDFKKFITDIRQSDALQTSKSILDVSVKGLTLSEDLRDVSTEDIFLAAEHESMFQKTVADFLDPTKSQPLVSTDNLIDRIQDIDIRLAASKNPEEVIQIEKERTEARKELRSLRARIALREIIPFMAQSGAVYLPLFHGVLPDREWSNHQDENIEAVNSYLRGCTVEQVLRFFLYRRMMAGGQPLEQASGLMAQEFEILNLVEDRDIGWRIPGTNQHLSSLKTRRNQVLISMTTDLLGEAKFLEDVARALSVSPQALAEACKVLREPVKNIAQQLAGVAKEPLQNGLEVYLAALTQSPKLTMGLTAPLLWIGSASGRKAYEAWFGSYKPSAIASRLKKAADQPLGLSPKKLHQLIHPEYHWENMREGYSKFETILERMRDIGGEYHVKAYKNLARWTESGANPIHLQSLVLNPAANDLAAIQAELTSIFSKGPPAPTALERIALLQSAEHGITEYIQVVESLKNGGNVTAQEAIMLTARPVRNGRMMRSIRSAGVAGNALWVGNIAAHGYTAYEDFQEGVERRADKKEVMSGMLSQLDQLADELTSRAQFQEKSNGSRKRVFVHTETGVEIDLSIAEEQLAQVGDAFDDRISAQNTRVAQSVIATASLAWMGPRAAMGPAGLVLIGIESAVRLGAAAYEQDKMRSFIQSAPPWILTKIGTEKTTGTSEYDWLRGASSWMLSDMMRPFSANEDKSEVAKKMLFAILMSDLRANAPEMLNEVMGDLETPDQIDAFFAGEFGSHVLPLLSLCLRSQTGIEWDAAKALDIDSGGFIVPPTVTLLQIRSACRSAIVLYREHQNQSNVHKLRALALRFDKEKKFDAMTEVATALAFLSEQKVLGVSIKDIPEGEKTLIEQLMQEARSVNELSTAGKTKTTFDVVVGNSNHVTVDLGSLATVSTYIEDPILRTRYAEVLVETTTEKEGRVYEGRTLEDVLTKSFWAPPDSRGIDPGHSYLLTLHAANNLRSAVDPKSKLSEGVAEDQLRRSISEDGIAVMSKRQPRSFGRYERGWYGTNARSSIQPLVFTHIDTGRFDPAEHDRIAKLFQGMTSPSVRGPEFSEDKILGVFFEGKNLGGSRSALATFVYGDPTTFTSDAPVLYVAQRAVATSATSNMQSAEQGLTRVWNGREFLSQPGTKDILAALQKGIVDRSADDQNMQKESLAKAKKEEQRREAERPKREKALELEQKLRSDALKKSETSSDLTYIPPVGEEGGLFRATIGAIHVQLFAPNFSSNIRADRSQESILAPRDSDRFHIELEQGGSKKAYDITLDFESLDALTTEEKEVIRSTLMKPYTLQGHPLAGDLNFVRAIRSLEISRLLDLVTYTGDWGLGWKWSAMKMRTEFGKKVGALYDQSPDKAAFLSKLYVSLRENRTINYKAFETVLEKLEATR